MKAAVVQLPGLNRDRDMISALHQITGTAPLTIWQTETTIPNVDLIVIPGGFSYGIISDVAPSLRVCPLCAQ